MTITPSEHAALTWAVVVAKRAIDVKEAAYALVGRHTKDTRQRDRIYEACRFLARKTPTEEVKS